MDFSQVTIWNIPEGEVIKVTTSTGSVIWQKPGNDYVYWTSTYSTGQPDGTTYGIYLDNFSTTQQKTIQYSYDGSTWKDWTHWYSADAFVTINKGPIMFRGKNIDISRIKQTIYSRTNWKEVRIYYY